MSDRIGRAASIGVLFSLAASVGLWSGALASASGTLHSHGQVHVAAQVQTRPQPVTTTASR
jgi:hypothetical protein